MILRKQSEGGWFLLMAYGVLLGIMIQFVWLKKSNMMHIEHMLPFLLFLMITLLNRFAYVQKQQYETMLSITNRRHLAKENVIQYERLQKKMSFSMNDYKRIMMKYYVRYMIYVNR